MFNRYLIPLFLTTTTVFIATPQVEAIRQSRAIQPRDVAAIAKKTTVRIESANGRFGSGAIVGRTEQGNKNIYTVLTAAHVVRNRQHNYQIITPPVLDNLGQKKRFKIDIDNRKNIKILPKIDLAIVTFESKYTFAIGTIGSSNNADEGTPVYVAGFPEPGLAIKRIAFQFTGGMISSRLDESDRADSEPNNGYDLAYTSVTRSGMSGGPVLDVAGRIIAIHGQGDRNNQTPEAEDSTGTSGNEKTGFNLGIPIDTFLKLQPQANKIIGARVDKSPVNYQLTDRSRTIGTKHQKFTKKLRIRSDDPQLLDVTKFKEQTPVEEKIANH
jgi:serine protease Do